MHIRLEPVGGISGDMFVGAILDAFPDLSNGLPETIRALGISSELSCRITAYRDHTLVGTRFEVELNGDEKSGYPHVDFSKIRKDLEMADLKPTIRQHAIEIFTILAVAEGKVHGIDVDRVSFHEVGSWDSITDIVSAAYLIDRLKGASWSVAPLPTGSGQVTTAHGLLPVPAPATTVLLEGFEWHDDGFPGERVTPTGAAILRYLKCAHRMNKWPSKLLHTGVGFGAKTIPGISNILRVTVFDEKIQSPLSDKVTEIRFEIDDQSAEDLAIGLEYIRSLPNVLDVIQIPAFGKKGRMISQVQVLAKVESTDEVISACFNQTTTIGLRYQVIERAVLPRKEIIATITEQQVRVKVTDRIGNPMAKSENDDIAKVGGDYVERKLARHEAEMNALDNHIKSKNK